MDKMHRPIGVFDSGLGGISVLRELVALMPEEDYIFYGDSKHAPYGTKTLEEVQRLTLEDAEYLVERQVKALVVACNTATSAAILLLRERYKDMPVIGIEPALKPAVHAVFPDAKQRQEKSLKPRVLVMATPMTLREKKFHNLMQTYEEEASIIPLPCPGLVEFVERGELEGEALERFLRNLFAPYQEEGVDCVVLGCTHYPFVRPMVQKVLGERVQIFDGGAGTARETCRRLTELQLRKPAGGQGTVWLENSLESPEMDMLGRKLLKAH
jgi:glutamate racemase